MLVRFVAKNFLSIGEEIEYNTLPYSKIKRHSNHIYEVEDLKVLKAGAVYGANGSGKSNFVKAIHLLHDIATNQEVSASSLTNICFRLKPEHTSKPTTLEIEFIKNKQLYGYGVDILNGLILEEWLVEIDHKEEKEDFLYRRYLSEDREIRIEVSPHLIENEKSRLLIEVYQDEILERDQSLLSLLRKKNRFPKIKDAYDWFLRDLYIVHPSSKFTNLVDKILNDEKFLQLANDIISKLDTGVSSLEIEEVPFDIFFGESDEETKLDVQRNFEEGSERVVIQYDKGIVLAVKNEEDKIVIRKIVTRHTAANGIQYKFELDEESDGTARLLDLIPAFESTLSGEKTFIIDEIGRSLHPALLKEFIQLFLNMDTRGQLVFTTHESNLLDLELFRQDEIWFVEKDIEGNTKMYPLSDFQPRYDLNIRKGYLQGRFGAIPFLSDLSHLLTNGDYATAK